MHMYHIQAEPTQLEARLLDCARMFTEVACEFTFSAVYTASKSKRVPGAPTCVSSGFNIAEIVLTYLRICSRTASQHISSTPVEHSFLSELCSELLRSLSKNTKRASVLRISLIVIDFWTKRATTRSVVAGFPLFVLQFSLCQVYQPGDRVVVLRSSGRWERGWFVRSVSDNGYQCTNHVFDKFISKREAPTHLRLSIQLL